MNFKEEFQRRFEDSEDDLRSAEEEYGGVYIAQIEEDTHFNLEVEISEGEIAFTIQVELSSFSDGSTPEDAYNELKDYLEEEGISVFENYNDWEEALSKNS